MATRTSSLLLTVLIFLMFRCHHALNSRSFTCTGNGPGECKLQGSLFVCANMSTSSTLEAGVTGLATNPDKLEILDSYISHLPLLNPGTLQTTVKEVHFRNTFVAFLAPPKKGTTKPEFQPFLKSLKTTKLEFTNVPYVHAFNWNNVNEGTESITVQDSRFVFIPQSLSNVTGLKFFIVKHSEVRWIHKDAFHGLKGLKVVDLSDNHIASLEDGTFASNNNLIKLFLNNNELVNLSPASFPKQSEGTTLHLGLNHNPLASVNFKNLTDIGLCLLSLEETNLNCDCGVKDTGELIVEGSCLDNNTPILWQRQKCICNYDITQCPEEGDYFEDGDNCHKT